MKGATNIHNIHNWRKCWTGCPAIFIFCNFIAAIAQLGERQTEDLKVPGSIPGLGKAICPSYPRYLVVRDFAKVWRTKKQIRLHARASLAQLVRA